MQINTSLGYYFGYFHLTGAVVYPDIEVDKGSIGGEGKGSDTARVVPVAYEVEYRNDKPMSKRNRRAGRQGMIGWPVGPINRYNSASDCDKTPQPLRKQTVHLSKQRGGRKNIPERVDKPQPPDDSVNSQQDDGGGIDWFEQ